MSRKINQEQIIIDRKLAWERVQKFLDDDEEEEEEEEEEDEKEEKSKSGKNRYLLFFSSFPVPNHPDR